MDFFRLAVFRFGAALLFLNDIIDRLLRGWGLYIRFGLFLGLRRFFLFCLCNSYDVYADKAKREKKDEP